jgi:hypothetical protein
MDMTRQLNIKTPMIARFDTQISLANNDRWLVAGGVGEVKIIDTVDGQVLACLDHRMFNVLFVWTCTSPVMQKADLSKLST